MSRRFILLICVSVFFPLTAFAQARFEVDAPDWILPGQEYELQIRAINFPSSQRLTYLLWRYGGPVMSGATQIAASALPSFIEKARDFDGALSLTSTAEQRFRFIAPAPAQYRPALITFNIVSVSSAGVEVSENYSVGLLAARNTTSVQANQYISFQTEQGVDVGYFPDGTVWVTPHGGNNLIRFSGLSPAFDAARKQNGFVVDPTPYVAGVAKQRFGTPQNIAADWMNYLAPALRSGTNLPADITLGSAPISMVFSVSQKSRSAWVRQNNTAVQNEIFSTAKVTFLPGYPEPAQLRPTVMGSKTNPDRNRAVYLDAPLRIPHVALGAVRSQDLATLNNIASLNSNSELYGAWTEGYLHSCESAERCLGRYGQDYAKHLAKAYVTLSVLPYKDVEYAALRLLGEGIDLIHSLQMGLNAGANGGHFSGQDLKALIATGISRDLRGAAALADIVRTTNPDRFGGLARLTLPSASTGTVWFSSNPYYSLWRKTATTNPRNYERLHPSQWTVDECAEHAYLNCCTEGSLNDLAVFSVLYDLYGFYPTGGFQNGAVAPLLFLKRSTSAEHEAAETTASQVCRYTKWFASGQFSDAAVAEAYQRYVAPLLAQLH